MKNMRQLAPGNKLAMDLQKFADEQKKDDPGIENEGADLTGAEKDETKKNDSAEVLTMDAVKKLIQSETDKVRTEYSKRLKEIEAEKEKLETEKMTEEEKARFELEKREKALAEKEAELNKTRLEIKTIDLLKENEIDLDAKPFVVGADEKEVAEKIKLLKSFIEKVVSGTVDGIYKSNGRTIEKGGDPQTELAAAKKELAAARENGARTESIIQLREKIHQLENKK